MEMLKRENVQILASVRDWKEAIEKSIEPLIAGGYATPDYIAGVIANTEELGPYYVLAEDIALIHARPEQGALQNQLAVTVVREPVHFAEDGTKDARVLVALSAVDGEAHIGVMQKLAEIFVDPAKITAIAEASNEDAIYAIFEKA